MITTNALNAKLQRELRVRQGVDFCKMKGLVQDWECNIVDGVHLEKGLAMYKFMKAVRSPIVHHSKKF